MKKNKILKLLIVILSFAFININVNAIEITTDSSTSGTSDTNSYLVVNTGELKVTNVSSSDVLSAYKILNGFYNKTANSLTYEFTSDFKAFLSSSSDYSSLTVDEYVKLTSGDITSGSTKSNETIDKLSSSYLTYIKQNNISGTQMSTVGTTSTLTCQVGAYLIYPTSTTNVYATMVGNVSLTVSNNEWSIEASEIVAKVSQASVSVTTGGDVSSTNENSYNTGEVYTNTVNVTVPQYPVNGTNTDITITIDTADGTDFSGLDEVSVSSGDNEFTVKVDSSDENKATIVDSNNEIIVTIEYDDSTGKITIVIDTTKVGDELEIEYKESLNKDEAVAGGSGNVDTVTLTYPTDPYTNGTTNSSTAKATAYTYGLAVYKNDSESTSTMLSGAMFDIYSDSNLTTKVGTTTLTDSSGKGTYFGLKAGTYYLKEVTAPTGYKLSSDKYTIIIGENGQTDTTEGYYKTTISNELSSLLDLPFTGGSGTVMYFLLGILLILIGIVAYICYRKNKMETS